MNAFVKKSIHQNNNQYRFTYTNFIVMMIRDSRKYLYLAKKNIQKLTIKTHHFYISIVVLGLTI